MHPKPIFSVPTGSASSNRFHPLASPLVAEEQDYPTAPKRKIKKAPESSLPTLPAPQDFKPKTLSPITKWVGVCFKNLESLKSSFSGLHNIESLDFSQTSINNHPISTDQCLSVIHSGCIPCDNVKQLNLSFTQIDPLLATHFPFLSTLSLTANKSCTYEKVFELPKHLKSLAYIDLKQTSLNLLFGLTSSIANDYFLFRPKNKHLITTINWTGKEFQRIQDLITILKNLPQTTELNMSYMVNIPDRITRSIQKPFNDNHLSDLMQSGCLDNIVHLDLSNTNVTLEKMTAPKNLKKLVIANCPVTINNLNKFILCSLPYTAVTSQSAYKYEDIKG